MRLHSNPASPFGRKAKVVAHEKGPIDRISMHVLQTTAVGPDCRQAVRARSR
jgi:glutathione S-transferase